MLNLKATLDLVSFAEKKVPVKLFRKFWNLQA
jgi:hypothetical protein